MTVAEVFEQAKILSLDERRELAKLLIDSLVITQEQPDTVEHWGQSLNQLMDELEPIEMKYSEIEDPVEWVKHLRSERRKNRLTNWSDNE